MTQELILQTKNTANLLWRDPDYRFKMKGSKLSDHILASVMVLSQCWHLLQF